MSRITVEAIAPEEHLEGGNILAAILGETGRPELDSFRINRERDDALFGWVGVQVMPYWWDNPEWDHAEEDDTAAQKRPGVLQLIAMRDSGVPPSALIKRPAWDEESQLDMDAALAAFASLQVLEELPQGDGGPAELPAGLVLYRGTGLAMAYGLRVFDPD